PLLQISLKPTENQRNQSSSQATMSGYTQNAIIHHGRLDDGVVVLQKPFRKAELAQRVREALEQEA
ncbi:MAG: hypothetical protein O3B08_05360, partial [Proteobacteria bacterium]|nr:hypothetical protein [Pseudomonadota bacterium]